MKNIVLIQPNYAVGIYKVKELYLPYSVGIIWAYVNQFPEIRDNFRVSDILFNREPADEVLSKIEKPDVAVFSNYIWNWEYNKVLAEKLKQKFPECIILFGGPQVTDNQAKHLPFFSKHKYINAIVNGEGEHAFYEILKTIADGKKLKRVYKTERIQNLDDIPSPYLTGVFDKIMSDEPTAVWQMVLETNRGCPFQCTFCDWGSTTYSKIKKFDLTRVLEEVKWACDRKIKLGFIADANFGVFYERDKELAENIVRIQNETNNKILFNITWNKNSQKKTLEIAEILAKHSGGKGITISIQSPTPEVLEAIKRKNMEVSNMSGMLEECNKRNIPVSTELILGLPKETYTTWQEGIYHLLDIGLHTTIECFFLTLLENSELNLPSQIEEHGIDLFEADFNNTFDDDVVEKQFIVRSTKYMSNEDMVQSYMFIWAIVCFHYSGLTQIYARYLNKKYEVSFREFYSKLLEEIKDPNTLFNKHYEETKSIISTYLNTGHMTDPYCVAKVGWNSILKLFENLPETNKAVEDFVYRNYEDLLTDEVTKFQHNFNVDINKEYPYNYTSDKNVYGYIFHNENYDERFEAELDINFKYADKSEFLRRMYLNRTTGGAKVKIIKL